MSFIRNQCKRVVLGISGGVDSSVAALILKKQGFDVHCLFMRNWDIPNEIGKCSLDQDLEDASRSCSAIGVPIHEVNFSKDYWNYVFSDLVEQYQNGQTPNPDVLCNRHIKFNRFIQYSQERFGADAIATGHYAQTTFGPYLEACDKVKGVHLLKAIDTFKDQTFFLNQINQNALQKVMFPLGSLKKSQVKKIAKENKLDHVARKKESTGICFIGRRNFSQFISEYILEKRGNFINIDTGRVMGSHCGIHQWTVGQRCRIGGLPDRLYVSKKISETQEILVALGKKHLSLWSQQLTTSTPHWIHSAPEILIKGGILNCQFRFQHTHPLVSCQVMLNKDNNSLIITLEKPLFALTPGQYAVIYKGDECLGGAKIESKAPSLYTLCKLDQL